MKTLIICTILAIILFEVVRRKISKNVIEFEKTGSWAIKRTKVSPTLWTLTFRKWMYYSNTQELFEILDSATKKLQKKEIDKLNGTTQKSTDINI